MSEKLNKILVEQRFKTTYMQINSRYNQSYKLFICQIRVRQNLKNAVA